MTNFFNLIRWKNLLLIILTQVLLKYALLEPEAFKVKYGITTTLNEFGFFLLVLATVCIAAAGYVINDIEDIVADKINKPNKIIVGNHISEKVATKLFLALNVIGVISGFLLSRSIDKPGFFVVFVLVSAILYMYSTYLKSIMVVGNIAVAIVVALSIYIIGIFDLIPAITRENQASQLFFLGLIKDYAIFAFMINLLREMVKDIEDIDGDYKMGIKSLPIVIGRERATKVLFLLSLIPVLIMVFYLTKNLYTQPIALVYVLLLIIAPLLFVTIKLFNAESKKDYKRISNVLKLVMLTGVLSLVLFQFILIK